MNLQFVIDGLLTGSMIGLGAIGITLACSILRFSNFAHGDLISWGAYLTMTIAAVIGAVVGKSAPIGSLSFGWTLIAALIIAAGLTGLIAIFLDNVLFARLRSKGQSIIVVMASFGASMALRNILEFIYTSRPAYFNRAIQIAIPVGFGVRITPDQIALLCLTAAVVGGSYILLTRTQTGRSMQAVSQNAALAQVAGIDIRKTIRFTWLLGGALACMAGVMIGILVQIRPLMGFDMLLPLFAAAILGGIGSLPGAVLGGIIIGVAEASAVQFVGAEWRSAVSFAILIAVLLIRPIGLFGAAER